MHLMGARVNNAAIDAVADNVGNTEVLDKAHKNSPYNLWYTDSLDIEIRQRTSGEGDNQKTTYDFDFEGPDGHRFQGELPADVYQKGPYAVNEYFFGESGLVTAYMDSEAFTENMNAELVTQFLNDEHGSNGTFSVTEEQVQEWIGKGSTEVDIVSLFSNHGDNPDAIVDLLTKTDYKAATINQALLEGTPEQLKQLADLGVSEQTILDWTNNGGSLENLIAAATAYEEETQKKVADDPDKFHGFVSNLMSQAYGGTTAETSQAGEETILDEKIFDKESDGTYRPIVQAALGYIS